MTLGRAVTCRPRWTAWLVVLLGIVTVAHLWAHSCAPYDGPARLEGLTMEAGLGHSGDGHHDETAHPQVFMLPDTGGLIAEPPALALALAAPPVRPMPAPVASAAGRDPPPGYRARAVLTRTLEVCRC